MDRLISDDSLRVPVAMDESYVMIERFAVETKVKPRTLRGQRLAACPRSTMKSPVQCDNFTEKSLDDDRPGIHRSTRHASVCNYGDQVTVRVDAGIGPAQRDIIL